jgi:hypothetical protein
MREQQELLNLDRTVSENRRLALIERGVAMPQLLTEELLLSIQEFNWFNKTARVVLHEKYHPYPTYKGPGNNGVFKIQKDGDDLVEILLLSDWATNTAESRAIAKQAGVKDYSIHLGDTYYVGDLPEIRNNFFPENGGKWPYGKLGSFAMLGNHEMYSGGAAYFRDLLPRMGTYAPGGRQIQEASFFCLENEYWRIIGLDTGYDSLKKTFRWEENEELNITQEQISWLTDQVRLNADKRGLIFLTHHQAFSAFDHSYPNPMEQLAELIDPGRDIIWFWGHEHRLAVYGGNPMNNGGKVYARCIGNSGMPVELNYEDGGSRRPQGETTLSPEAKHLVLFDQRGRKPYGNLWVGFNGFEVLGLQADNLRIEYYDNHEGWEQGKPILSEMWKIDQETGRLTGTEIRDHTSFNPDPDAKKRLSWFLGAQITDAVGNP